jgi:hypothetical protein
LEQLVIGLAIAIILATLVPIAIVIVLGIRNRK